MACITLSSVERIPILNLNCNKMACLVLEAIVLLSTSSRFVVKEWAELSTRFGPGAGVDVAAPLAGRTHCGKSHITFSL